MAKGEEKAARVCDGEQSKTEAERGSDFDSESLFVERIFFRMMMIKKKKKNVQEEQLWSCKDTQNSIRMSGHRV